MYLKLHSYHHREVAPRFRHVDESVITGVVVIAAIQQVVCMKRHVERLATQQEVLSCREVQRPIAVSRLFRGNDLVLCTYDVSTQANKPLTLVLEAVFHTSIYRPWGAEG